MGWTDRVMGMPTGPSFNSIPSPSILRLDVSPSFRVFVPAATTSTTDSKSFYVHLNLDVRLPTIADGTTRRSPTVMYRTIAIVENDRCRFAEDKVET